MTDRILTHHNNKRLLYISLIVLLLVFASIGMLISYWVGVEMGADNPEIAATTDDDRDYDRANETVVQDECTAEEIDTIVNSNSPAVFDVTYDGSLVLIDTGSCVKDISEQTNADLNEYYGHGFLVKDTLAYGHEEQMKIMYMIQTNVSTDGPGPFNFEIVSLDLTTSEVTSVYKFDLEFANNVDLLSVRSDISGETDLYFTSSTGFAADCVTPEGCEDLVEYMEDLADFNCNNNRSGLMKINLETKQVTTLEKSAECV